MDLTLLESALSPASLHHIRSRARLDERGEGVISAAIAVLIMAVIGAALFTAFRSTREHINTNIDTAVDGIQGN